MPRPSAQRSTRRRQPQPLLARDAAGGEQQLSLRRRRLQVVETTTSTSTRPGQRLLGLGGLFTLAAALGCLAGVGALVVEHPCCANHLHV